MTTTSRQHRAIRRSGVNDYKGFYAPVPPVPPQRKIANDLVVAYKATERLAQNLNELLKDSDFTSHRLWREGITSNSEILSTLIETINNIGLEVERQELEREYPDYFTK